MFNSRLVKRKWGYYITILDRKHFKVKLLRFLAGKCCSLQKHNYRNELWLFLTGSGAFLPSPDACSYYVGAGEYRIVPAKEEHKYLSYGKSFILEIQYGERCDEEDIVRI